MIDVTNYLSYQIHGSADGHGSGGVAHVVGDFLTFLESLAGLSSTELFAAVLPGAAGMANVHPFVVHFPIAFLSAFFLIDLLGSLFNSENWRKLASGLLYLGTIAAAITVAAGLMAASSVEHGENVHQIMTQHQYIGFSVLALSIFLSLWRLALGSMISGFGNFIFLFFAAILNVLIILGADSGGMMVYKYGVAVDAVEVTSMDYFHEHTHSH